MTPEAQANDDAAMQLEKHQVDFDFVDDDLLRPDTVSGGVIHVGKMSYRALVASQTRMMPARTAAALAQFVRSGGTLIAVGSLPETGPAEHRSFLEVLETASLRVGEERRFGAGRVVLTSPDKLARWVHPSLTLEPASSALRVAARRLSAGTIYLITNESDSWVEAEPRIPAPMRAKISDPETGTVSNAPRLLRLAPWGSTCLLLDRQPSGAQSARPDISRSVPIEGSWRIRRIARTLIADDDYKREAFRADPWRPATLGDWRDVVGADFSGTAEYGVSFDYRGPAGEDRFLDLGTVACAAEVWLNGEKLGARAWNPYWIRTGKALRQGSNELRVQITNTLANYLVSPGVRADWAARKGPGWPGVYDARAHDFESKSTRSGLFGPVRLLPIGGGSSKD